MENLVPLIVLGVLALIVLGVVWYIITRFPVNIGATEVGIKERRYFGHKMAQGRVVATEGEVSIHRKLTGIKRMERDKNICFNNPLHPC